MRAFTTFALIALFSALPLLAGQPAADAKAKGPEHNVTLAEEPGVLELLNKAQKARVRAEKDPEVWPECVRFYAEILKKYPNTVYLDRWEGPDKTDMAYKNGLYKSTREKVAGDIASLLPAGLAIYRMINDPAARAIFNDAQEQLDERKMEQVAQEYYPTSFGDKALVWLAEEALDRGMPRQALVYLKQALKHPNPSVSKLGLLVRLLQAQASVGDRAAAEKTLRDLQVASEAAGAEKLRVGHAEGGAALDLLRARVAKAGDGKTDVKVDGARSWETYFGNAAHDRVLQPRTSIGIRKWSVPIQKLLYGPTQDIGPKNLSTENNQIPDPTMNFHLVAKDGYFYLCDNQVLAAYPTGNPQPGLTNAGGNVKFLYPTEVKPQKPNADEARIRRFGRNVSSAIRQHPYFATVSGDRLYVVQGATARTQDPDNMVWFGMNNQPKQDPNWLVALGYQSGKLIWTLQPDAHSDALNAQAKADQEWLKTIFFCSAPVYEGGVLYMTAAQTSGLNEAWVAAFDADTGRLLWRTMVCSATAFSVSGPVQPDLGLPPAVANGTVYVVTNLGAVAALDAMSGSIKWLRVYDRLQPVDRMNPNRGGRMLRDFWGPNPPILHENLVIATPQDSEMLYAYDIETGRRVWEVSRTERDQGLKHILGITGNALVISGTGVHFYELKGGRETGDVNNPINFDSQIKGRGLVTGNIVLVPTADALVSIDAAIENGKLRPKVYSSYKWQQKDAEAGNLFISDDVLYTTSGTHVNAFFVWEEMEARLKNRIKDNPSDLAAYGELADVYHKVERFEQALTQLDAGLALAEKSKDEPKVAGFLTDLRRRKFDVLMAQGQKQQAGGGGTAADLPGAYASFQKALAVATQPGLPEVLPVMALRAMAEIAAAREDLTLAVLHYQQIIRQCGDVVYAHVPGSSTKARLFAQERIEEIKQKNAAAYAKIEEEAKAALTAAANDPKQLEAALANYPNAEASGSALLKLSQLSLDKNPDQARQYALLFLSRYSRSPQAATATAVLAVACERGNLLSAAKDLLRRLASRKDLAEQTLSFDPLTPAATPPAPLKAAEWAAKRLAENAFKQTPSSAILSMGDGKLRQAWTRPAGEPSIPLQPRGVPPQDIRRCLFYVENRTELVVISAAEKGQELWTPRPALPAEVMPKPNQQELARFQFVSPKPVAAWAGPVLLVLGSKEVVAYDSREKGKVVWRRELKNPIPDQRCSLRVNYGRVVLGYPSGNLVVLNAISGEQLWETQVDGNQFAPAPAVGEGFVALTSLNPGRITLFDLETGAKKGAIETAPGAGLPAFPIAQGDRLFYSERTALNAVDGATGKLLWQYNAGGAITRLAGNRELIVAVVNDRSVIALNAEQAGEPKAWSPVLERESKIRDVYADGDDLYVVAGSDGRKSELLAFSVRLEGKKLWAADISANQLDSIPVNECSVATSHVAVTQTLWDQTGDKPAAVVLIDRKTGLRTWAETLASEHHMPDADGFMHPPFTVQLADGGLVITESRRRTAWLVPETENIEQQISKLQQEFAQKPDDLDVRGKLALKLFEKGDADAAAPHLAAVLGSKQISDEKFVSFFAEFARLRQERAKQHKRSFVFSKVADGGKLDMTPESWAGVPVTNMSNWLDVYFPSDDETSGAIRKDGWRGPEDLSVAFRGAYDNQNLYMLFVVKDDKHKNEQSDGAYCDVGDSVKVAFDIDRDGGLGYRGEDFVVGACLNQAGAALSWRWVEHGQYLSGNTPLQPAAQVVRNEQTKQTVYKLTLPLANLTLKAENARKFGFCFMVNDQDDGATVGKSIGSSPGLIGSPWPALFAEGVLQEKQ
ncbi:MAG TPA: PQQ-binding-like beta-propeller repeat protein [Planctomycetota bacterium]|jgi:outer membrane protein assembly factor BamB